MRFTAYLFRTVFGAAPGIQSSPDRITVNTEADKMKLSRLLPLGFLLVVAPRLAAQGAYPIQNIQLNNALSNTQSLQRDMELSQNMHDTFRQTQEIQQQVRAAEETKREIQRVEATPKLSDAHDYYRQELQSERAQTRQKLSDILITAPLQDAKRPDDSTDGDWREARESSRRAEYYSDQMKSHEATDIGSDDDQYVDKPESNSTYENAVSDDTDHETSQSKGDVSDEKSRVKDIQLPDLKVKDPDFDNSQKPAPSEAPDSSIPMANLGFTLLVGVCCGLVKIASLFS
jgi:hypothetical protein